MKVILFDGVCNFCNSSINYIMDHDGGEHGFASLQSAYGQSILAKHHRHTTDFDSIVLVDNDKIYEKSEAVIRIAQHVKGWKWIRYVAFLPQRFRDAVYGIIARNRYRWFGRKESCRIPTLQERARFVG